MKVLIISHNPITTYQNMGKTMLSLFSSFEKTELCQFYIYPTVPDISVCNSYFRVTDRDVLKSFARFGKMKSRTLRENDIDPRQRSMYENEKDASFYKKNKKNSVTLICRDIMWAMSHWYNAALKKWLDQEKPTCIFLAPGESKFIYHIAFKIAKKRNIPVFTYVCDDYYFVNPPKNIVDRFQLYLLRRKMKSAMENSKEIITICDELAQAYHTEFGTATRTVFTGTNFPIAEQPSKYSAVQGITYMGNTTCNRIVPIAEIGRALDKINEAHGTEYRLFLYTPPLKETTKQLFSGIRSIQYCGYVTGDDFKKLLHGSPILLHVEAFDPKSIDRVKHSVSTKIADSLGSGNLLFAYGPDQVASIQHLIRNDCAVVVTNPEKLEDTLYTLLQGTNRNEVIQKALATAKKYHSSDKNSLILHGMFAEKASRD